MNQDKSAEGESRRGSIRQLELLPQTGEDSAYRSPPALCRTGGTRNPRELGEADFWNLLGRKPDKTFEWEAWDDGS